MASASGRKSFGKRIYADAAAATPLSPAARRELLRLLDSYGNAGALHREALEAKKELDAARAAIAAAIAAHPHEIVFTASGTEGNNLAIEGTLRPLLRQHHKLHAITPSIEHQSVLEPLRALRSEGLELTELPVDQEGIADPRALAEAIRGDTAFVSIQLVNSEIGTLLPVREYAKTIRHARKTRAEKDTKLPIIFHTDASQAPFWVRINVEQLGIDLLTLDAQKVQGPKGVGALYIRRGTEVESLIRGGVQERGLRAGTPNVPLIGSFAVALTEAQAGVEKRIQKTSAVRDYLWEQIKKRLPVVLNGPQFSRRVANNLNISIPGLDGEAAVIALDALGIAASTRSACDTKDEDPSHVIRAIGAPLELTKTAIRFTLLPSATKAEAKRMAAALERVCDLYSKK